MRATWIVRWIRRMVCHLHHDHDQPPRWVNDAAKRTALQAIDVGVYQFPLRDDDESKT